MTAKKNTKNTKNTAQTKKAPLLEATDPYVLMIKALSDKIAILETAHHNTILGLDPLAYSEPDTESFARARNALTDLLGVVKSFAITYDHNGILTRAVLTLDPDYFTIPMPIENSRLIMELERNGTSIIRAYWRDDDERVTGPISDGLASFYLNWLDTLHMDAVRERLEMAGIQ